ncbi:MAG: hypothetical protein M0Z54_04445 [Thermaerobacter sp.]|nr:hypothetical protein [Thermaerobacter sp.]
MAARTWTADRLGPSSQLWRVAWLFVPAAMIYALWLFGARGWDITGGSYVRALVQAGVYLQAWMPLAGAWYAGRPAPRWQLFAHLVRIQAATGLMMAALYVLMSLAMEVGPDPWFGITIALNGPYLPLTIALVVVASWAFTSLAMLVGTLGARIWSGWSVAIAALGLLVFYLRLFSSGIEFNFVHDYLFLRYPWEGGGLAPPPANPWGLFLGPFAACLALFAATMLALALMEHRRAHPTSS